MLNWLGSSSDGQLHIFPEYILAHRSIKRHNEVVSQLLVKWSNLSESDALWEDYASLKDLYPNAFLEKKNVFEKRRGSRNSSIAAIEWRRRSKEQIARIRAEGTLGQVHFKRRAIANNGTSPTTFKLRAALISFFLISTVRL
jgi:Chromo (CHRromatin Organisation MOdifier) domain